MANEEDILTQISLLAGQINRHKNAQQSFEQPYANIAGRGRSRGGIGSVGPYNKHNVDYFQATSSWRGRGGYTPRGYTRGGRSQVHRHRSLVLNGGGTTTPTNGENTNPVPPTFVSKSDRHLQLINTSVYEQKTLGRAKAMEETRKLKLKQRDEHEKAKLKKHFYRSSGQHSYSVAPPSDTIPIRRDITVQGIQFYVTKDGSKLIKSPGDLNAAKATPKTVLVGGVKFHRSKNGNLIRHGVIQANRKIGIIKKVDVPCTSFGTMGSCPKGPRCRYVHDASKVAVCRDFLLKGLCPSGDSCDLSHDLTPERIPACVHFTRGMCSNADCKFSHVRVAPNASVCKAFGSYGYCEKGLGCEDRHVHECPDFSNTGKCSIRGCRLPHREKASIMRTNPPKSEEDSSDISSDEDEEDIDSDDIDSDDCEEFMGDNSGKPDSDFLQQDFVQFS